MNNITSWIKDDLYPTLFEYIDIAFPEHQFKKKSGNWVSPTYLNGTLHKHRKDKTVISKKVPGVILEQGGDVQNLIEYVIKRDGVDFITAVSNLAQIVNLTVPKNDNFNLESYKKQKDQELILEECNSYFVYSLKNNPEAVETLNYLQNRGYTIEEIEAMELGFIPSQDKLINYLLSKNYSNDLLAEILTFNTDTRIGTTHHLSIPYRSNGQLKGFKFRTISDAISPKYLNTKGLDKNTSFFNISSLKGNKDLIIVEGELDCLHASVKGIENVVATGGNKVSIEQIENAIKKGAKSFTICLDYEPNKEQETINNVYSIIQIILENKVNKIYIVTLGNNENIKIDPDSYIRNTGIDEFKKLIAQAINYYDYKLYNIFQKYGKIQDTLGLQDKDIHNLLEEVVEIASVLNPIDKSIFLHNFLSREPIQNLGITEQSLEITIDQLTATKDKEKQSRELRVLLSEASQLQLKGSPNQAIDLLKSKINEVALKDKVSEFFNFFIPINESELKDRLRNKPESLKAGYTIDNEDLLIPSGAITVLAAPTSHGKTTFLINIALNIVEQYKNKEIYFFSYEEDADSVLINSLNTYLNTNISGNNRITLKNHFSGNNKVQLPSYSNSFFNDLIHTKRLSINYCNYDSDMLIDSIRYLHKNSKVGIIIIDYIQLLNLPKGKYKTYSRQEEIKQICIDLKNVAVETGLPILLGAQFNRTVVNHTLLHATNIGEAGDIERIANLILGFWNNNFKPIGTDGQLNEINKNGNLQENTLFTTILKNRGGLVGLSENLNFNGNTGKIENSKDQNIYNPFN